MAEFPIIMSKTVKSIIFSLLWIMLFSAPLLILAEEKNIPKGERNIAGLIQSLQDKDDKTRINTLEALSSLGPAAKEAIPHLFKLLNHPITGLRCRAASAISSIDPRSLESISILTNLLKVESRFGSCRVIAADILGGMGARAKEAIPDMIRILQDQDAIVRARTAAALGKIGIGEDYVVSALIQILKDKDHLVQDAAANALGNIGPQAKEAVPHLITALGDETAFVRSRAGEALVKIGAAPALIQALGSEDIYVRSQAVEALGKIMPATKEVIQALIKSLEDPNSEVRIKAASALSKNQEPEVKEALKRYQKRETQLNQQEKTEAESQRSKLYTKEDVAANIPADNKYKYPLELEYAFPIYVGGPLSAGEPRTELFVTLHEGTDRSDRLVIWQKVNDKFKILEPMDAEEGPGISRFGQVVSFRYKGKLFIHIPLLYSGTGHFRKDTIFYVNYDNLVVGSNLTLDRVVFEAAPKWYKDKLNKGEGVWKGESNSFTYDKLEFEFYIWKEGDGNCCPTAGRVKGIYKIVGENKFDFNTKKYISDFKIIVDT